MPKVKKETIDTVSIERSPTSNNSSATKYSTLKRWNCILHLLNISVALLMGYGGYYQTTNQNGDYKRIIIGLYSMVFALFILIAELTECALVDTYCNFLRDFFGRGLFYFFVGTILFEKNGIMTIIGSIIISIGGLYVILQCQNYCKHPRPLYTHSSIPYDRQQNVVLTPRGSRV